jgi:hypothetical protein
MAMLGHKLKASRAGQSSGIFVADYAISGFQSSGNSSYSFDISTLDIQQDDLLIMFHGVASTANKAGNATTGASAIGPATDDPSLAWTLICDLYADDNVDANLFVAYKVVGVTPPSTIEFGDNNGTTNGTVLGVIVVRGVDTTTPMDATATTATKTNGPNVNPLSITPVTADAVVMVIVHGARDGTTFDHAGPSGMTEVCKTNGTGTDFMSFVIVSAYYDWTSGAYDPAAITGDSAAADSGAAVTIALRPA